MTTCMWKRKEKRRENRKTFTEKVICTEQLPVTFFARIHVFSKSFCHFFYLFMLGRREKIPTITITTTTTSVIMCFDIFLLNIFGCALCILSDWRDWRIISFFGHIRFEFFHCFIFSDWVYNTFNCASLRASSSYSYISFTITYTRSLFLDLHLSFSHFAFAFVLLFAKWTHGCCVCMCKWNTCVL